MARGIAFLVGMSCWTAQLTARGAGSALAVATPRAPPAKPMPRTRLTPRTREAQDIDEAQQDVVALLRLPVLADSRALHNLSLIHI